MLFKTEKSNAIISFLGKDLLINQNMIGIIENDSYAEIYVDDINNPKGVFIKKDYFHYIYSKEDSFIDEVCETFSKDGFYGFSGVEETIARKIKNKFQINWDNPCDLYYMPKDNLDVGLIKNEVRNIDVKDAETIDNYYEYSHPGSVEMIKKDILERPSSAIYVDDEIVCWVLVHPDNSIGIMYTQEEHRRKGYAVDVTIDLTSKIIENGKIPYLHIVNRNSMSPGLAKKCGFIKCGIVNFFGIIVGTPKEFIDVNNQIREQFLEDFKEESFKNVNYNGLYFLTNNLGENYIDISDFNLDEVKDLDMVSTWCDIVCKGLDMKEENEHKFKKRITNLVQNNNINYKFYIGYLKGIPVSTSCLLEHKSDEEVAGLHFLSTIPDTRNKGIGTKTIVETLKQARKNDYYLAVVQTPDIYTNMFNKIGFKISNTKSI